jgi:hypothetical protein
MRAAKPTAIAFITELLFVVVPLQNAAARDPFRLHRSKPRGGYGGVPTKHPDC